MIFRFAILICSLLVTATLFAQSASRPNIILIITDDQGYGDLAVHGNPIIRTPQLDRLHAQSKRFVDFHVSPTCAPTRSALQTGRHEFYNGISHTIHERERLRLDSVTLAELLKTNGYHTAMVGKWHLGDEPDYWPNKRGFEHFFIHGAGGIGQSYPGSCGDAPANKYDNPVILNDGKFVTTNGYCTDVFFQHATQWIDQHRQDKEPFYLQLATNAPHAPYNIAAEKTKPYDGKVPPEVARFYAMIENIDDNIGKLLTQLKDWKIEQNTLVIFMTDNGSAAGSKVFSAGMRGQKGTPYMGGTRVPSFWHWPGKIKPGDVSQTAAHIDILPTLAEITGSKLTEKYQAQVQGRSFAGLLMETSTAWPDRYLFTHVGRWELGADLVNAPEATKYANCSVRWQNYHLVRAGQRKNASGWELYDLTKDPGEQTNIADQKPELVQQISKEYDRWWDNAVPNLVNEKAYLTKPSINTFRELYFKQFDGPGPNNAKMK
jgi:arylsulfatase A-like enzyme